MTKVRKITAGLVGSAIALALVLPVHGAAAGTGSAGTTTQGTPGTGTTDWLTDVNVFREMAGLGPVVEDTSLSDGASKHSCYMLRNGMTHDEVAGRPGYTPEGANAGASGNVAVSSSTSTTDRAFVELWMTGPFHAIGVLQPHLTTVGYGRCNDGTAAQWRAGATLDIITDIRESQRSARRTAPILFPGDGAVTTLDRFIAETPDPRDFCGYPKGGANPVGLPVIAMMPERLSGPVTGTISGPAACSSRAPSRSSTPGPPRSPAPRRSSRAATRSSWCRARPLAEGTYTVTAGSGTGSVSWSFTVDADAALGLPAPTATPSAQRSRSSRSAPPVDRHHAEHRRQPAEGPAATTTLQIGGQGGVPLDASAVSANFTVLGQAGWGYLTVWDCNATMPVVSTVNFRSGEVAPNAATVPLAPGGRLCVYSTTDTHLLVDVNGAYGSAGTARFTPLAPVRLMDSREGHGTPGRLRAGQTVPLTIAGANGVPSGVSAVTLNVTSIDAASDRLGYVTAHACDTGRPLASNLNPTGGRDRPNLVIVPVASDGSVCLYTDNGDRPRRRPHRLPEHRVDPPVHGDRTLPLRRHARTACGPR